MKKIPNEPKSDSKFWIFRVLDLFWPRFVSDFDIRISDFPVVRLFDNLWGGKL